MERQLICFAFRSVKKLNCISNVSVRNCHVACSKYYHNNWNMYNKIDQNKGKHVHTTLSYAENNESPVLIRSSKYQTRSDEKIQKISKAMRAYIQRAQEHDDFIKRETEEFELGKRHLANMMGVDPDQMTQDDIDEAISYLMPSGLFEPKARPFMRHPKEVFPKQKAAEFDITGRPFHYLFYTGTPNFYQILHDVAIKLEELDAYQDQMIRRGILNPPSEMTLILTGSEWIKIDNIKKMILEEIKDVHYDYLIVSLTRLLDHPYSYREKEFIMHFRKILTVGVTDLPIPPQEIGEDGRPYSKATGTRKKLSVANVIVRSNGTGKVNINGRNILYFDSFQDRQQVLYPLQFTGLLNKVDIEVDVTGTGHSAQAGAVRYGISQALLSFVDTETMEKMRLAGLLTRDLRSRERKKPGQKGARAKYTWKKR